MEPPSLEVFNRHLDVAPGDVVWGDCGGAGLMLDWMILNASSNLNDCVILCWFFADQLCNKVFANQIMKILLSITKTDEKEKRGKISIWKSCKFAISCAILISTEIMLLEDNVEKGGTTESETGDKSNPNDSMFRLPRPSL